MAIKITDNFQVNIKNPIDNRFVVGSQSIPGTIGTVYPTPFYAYRDDISSNIGFVYPGLRIWDFNENLPYVWTGTTWSNENLTGASVLGSGQPGFTGYPNYVVKFYNNGTVLTKSLLFDDNVNIALVPSSGIITPTLPGDVPGTNPNGPSSALGGPGQSSGSISQGLHVQGRIRTNNGFVGIGTYITDINATNINTGYLNLLRISTSGANLGGVTYMLTTNNSGLTTWQDVVSVVPHWYPTTIGPGVSLYSGENGSNQYEFFSLVSTGLNITDGTTGGGSVRIESKAGQNLGLPNTGQAVYKGLNSQNIHEYYKLSSSTLKLANDGTYLTIDAPTSASIPALYVNNSYIPTYDEWSRYKGNNQLYTLGHITANEYAGDGTVARPFTNTVIYTSPTTYTYTGDTAIANGIRSYLGTGTRISPQRMWEQIVVQGGFYIYTGDFNYNRLNIVLKDATIESNPTIGNWLVDLDDTVYFAMNDTVSITVTIEGYAGIRLKKSGFRNSGTRWAEALYTKSKIITITGNDPNKCSVYLDDPGSSNPNQYVIIESNWNGGSPIGYNTSTGLRTWSYGLDVNGNPNIGTGYVSTNTSDTYVNDYNATFDVNKVCLRTQNQPILKIGSLISDFRDVIFSVSSIGFTNLDPTMIAFQFGGTSYTRTDSCKYFWFGAIPTVQFLQRGFLLKHTCQLNLTSPLLNGGLTDCLVYAEHLTTTVDNAKQPYIRLTNSTTMDGMSITNAAYNITGDIFKSNLTSGKWSSIYMNNCFINRGRIDESKINLRGPYNIQSVINNIGDDTGWMKVLLSGSLERNTFQNRGTLFVLHGLDLGAQGTAYTTNPGAGPTGTLLNNYSGDVTALIWRDNTDNSGRTTVQVTMKNPMQVITGSGLIKTNGTGNATLFANGAGKFLSEMPVGSIIQKIGVGTVGIVASVTNDNSATLVLSSNITTNLSVTTFSAYYIIRPYLVKFYIESLGNTTTVYQDNNLAFSPVYKIVDGQNFILSIAENSNSTQDIKIHFEAIQL